MVTRIHLRLPLSSAFNRFTACNVVPEPAKKSTTIASFLSPMKNHKASLTEYNDLGYVYSAIIQIDLSSYEFNNAEIKMTTHGNPYYGLGDLIKESGLEITGKDFSKVIYEITISK